MSDFDNDWAIQHNIWISNHDLKQILVPKAPSSFVQEMKHSDINFESHGPFK